MENKFILEHVDYTVLKAHSTMDDIFTLCDDAIAYKTASVCIPPSYVRRVNDKYKHSLKICTVIGFPLGYSTTDVKVFEAKQAIANGAVEIDMVVNLGDIKNKNYDLVLEEIKMIKDAIGENLLKVIIETCYLTSDEIVELTKIVGEAKAEYIKTSTGFGTEGATVENIKLIKNQINNNGLKMKASGGIRTKQDMEEYVSLGVNRLGVSSIESLK